AVCLPNPEAHWCHRCRARLCAARWVHQPRREQPVL
ncbi:hypothetical protein BN1708_018796, partial [Verticillium longisporum]